MQSPNVHDTFPPKTEQLPPGEQARVQIEKARASLAQLRLLEEESRQHQQAVIPDCFSFTGKELTAEEIEIFSHDKPKNDTPDL